MARKNGDAVSAIAGMFILLPGVLSSWLLPERTLPKGRLTPADLINANADYLAANWPIIILSAVIVAFGSMALLSYVLHGSRPTVSASLRLGLTALPAYLLVSTIQTFAVAGGAMLFVIPGIYLVSRFICIAPVTVAEEPRRPLAIISRSFQLTQDNGWRIILLLAVILVIGIVISTILGTIVGIIGALLLPPDVARLANILVGSIVQTALAVSVTLISAALYRQAAATTA